MPLGVPGAARAIELPSSGQKIMAQARSMSGSPTVVISKSTTQATFGGAAGAQIRLSTL
ncbi:Uncharacterised protein [Mycobacterium tuberculosis]|nr:Uncharacterised protein [Mycobacterium tuberculosis]